MEQGAQEAKAGGTAGTFVPPQKKSMGQLGGIRSPPGLDRLEHDLK